LDIVVYYIYVYVILEIGISVNIDIEIRSMIRWETSELWCFNHVLSFNRLEKCRILLLQIIRLLFKHVVFLHSIYTRWSNCRCL